MTVANVKEGPISQKRSIGLAVLVVALGYFVDIYDLVLFVIIRVKSLNGIGIVDPIAVREIGAMLLSIQMYGMLVGGILWGILGDKKGRLSVLFGSICLYSLANLANAYIVPIGEMCNADPVTVYAILRFLAGVGLAGELGAGITLVSEMMSRESRGWGTSLVAGIGVLGAAVAYLIGDQFAWNIAYIVGGVMGLALLCLRIGVMESGMFKDVASKKDVSKGNFLSLFSSKQRILRYAGVILIGLPLWYVVGILIGFSNDIGRALGMTQAPDPGRGVMFFYIGLSLGNLVIGVISQYMKSRKKPTLIFLSMTAISIYVYFFCGPFSLDGFYWVCLMLGIFAGSWAMFVTIAAEQFGINIRATVATTAPNFVRGLVGPMVLVWQFGTPLLGMVGSAAALAVVVMSLSIGSLFVIRETFGKDLDYVESHEAA